MIYVTYLAATFGEPYQILYGKDYLGNRCGRGDFWNRTKVVYPRIDRDLLEQSAVATTAPWRVVFYGLCVPKCPDVHDPRDCFGNPERCIVRDYGTEDEWKAAGGKEYYFQVLPTLDVLNRCIPTKSVRSDTPPDRCAFPVCDPSTNSWMVCDEEYPELWKISSFRDAARCEVKFQHVEIDQFATMEPSPLVQRIADKMAFMQRVVMGLWAARGELAVFGCAVPVGLGVIWLVLLRFFARTIVWLSVLAIGLLLAAITIYLFATSGALADAVDSATRNTTAFGGMSQRQANRTVAASEAIVLLAPDSLTEASSKAQAEDPTLYLVAAWICLILTVLYLLLLCLARKKIRVAATLVKESTVTLKDRPWSFSVPAWLLLAQAPLLIYFVVGLLWLNTANLELQHFTSSAEDVVGGSATSTYAQSIAALNRTSDPEALGPNGGSYVQPVTYLYFLFGILWALESVTNIGWTALSGNFSDWYFFRRDDAMRSVTPLLSSFHRVLRYHLGSIFFGSFIIAVIQLVRLVLAYIDKQTKGLQQKNLALKVVFKVVQCCLWCFQKCVQFITNYAYIYIAMQGSSFCTSCFATFKLIVTQPAQLALNNAVRTILSLLQLLAIPFISGWGCHAVLEGRGAPEPLYAAGLAALFAYVVAKAFALVMACALDTLFVCCVRDKAEYDAAFMSDRLRTAFGYDKTDRKERRKAKRAAKAESAEQASSAKDANRNGQNQEHDA